MDPEVAPERIREEFERLEARLRSTRERAFGAVVRRGEASVDDPVPVLELPSSFGRLVAEALLLERTAPTPGAAEALERHYAEWLPTGLVEQLGRRDPRHARLFHAPLDLAGMPRLRSALDGFRRLDGDAGVATGAGKAVRDGVTVAGFYATTHFGGLAPILHCTPADAARMQRALDEGTTLSAVVDRWLVPPLVHELAHGPRHREALAPPLLDEGLAGWFGQRAFRGFAFPDGDEAHSIYLASRFTQLGLSFARTFGEAATWRAHAGLSAWSSVLPEGFVEALARIGRARQRRDRALHLLPKDPAPESWAKLFALARTGVAADSLSLENAGEASWRDLDPGDEHAFDEAFATEALDAMCLQARLERGSYVVERRWPGAVLVDFERAVVTRPKRVDPLEFEAPLHLFPPATAARWRASGVSRLEVVLDGPAAVAEAVRRLFERAPFVVARPLR